jgi:hypothetical protein
MPPSLKSFTASEARTTKRQKKGKEKNEKNPEMTNKNASKAQPVHLV